MTSSLVFTESIECGILDHTTAHGQEGVCVWNDAPYKHWTYNNGKENQFIEGADIDKHIVQIGSYPSN